LSITIKNFKETNHEFFSFYFNSFLKNRSLHFTPFDAQHDFKINFFSSEISSFSEDINDFFFGFTDNDLFSKNDLFLLNTLCNDSSLLFFDNLISNKVPKTGFNRNFSFLPYSKINVFYATLFSHKLRTNLLDSKFYNDLYLFNFFNK
jgi:hypothetical protein